MVALFSSTEPLQQTNDSTLPDARSNARPLALIVEDHDDTRQMLRCWLEYRDYRVAEAEDGAAAVRLAEETTPDLILMDAKIPVLDGFAAAREIRRLASLDKTPIIFLSAHAEPHFCATALAAGADEYLIKPLDLSRLDETLDRHLDKLLPAAA